VVALVASVAQAVEVRQVARQRQQQVLVPKQQEALPAVKRVPLGRAIQLARRSQKVATPELEAAIALWRDNVEGELKGLLDETAVQLGFEKQPVARH
jgi:hypothetical protein